MDTIVAVRASSPAHGGVYFLTWGRVQDAVDTAGIERVVSDYVVRSTDLRDVEQIEVCASLGEAANAPFFFESFFDMSQRRRPEKGWQLALWRRRTAKRMARGQDIWFLGLPRLDEGARRGGQ